MERPLDHIDTLPFHPRGARYRASLAILRTLSEKGASATDIAAALGCSRQSVCRVMSKLGIEPRARYRAQSRTRAARRFADHAPQWYRDIVSVCRQNGCSVEPAAGMRSARALAYHRITIAGKIVFISHTSRSYRTSPLSRSRHFMCSVPSRAHADLFLCALLESDRPVCYIIPADTARGKRHVMLLADENVCSKSGSGKKVPSQSRFSAYRNAWHLLSPSSDTRTP